MALPGLDAPLPENDHAEVARLTTRSLMRTVPPALPGIFFLSGGKLRAPRDPRAGSCACHVTLGRIFFLSGGMGAEEATFNLQQVNRACPHAPWSLTFSYGRALQDGVIKTWAGRSENRGVAQDLLRELARVNAEASVGEWDEVHPVPGRRRLTLPKLSYSSERRQPVDLFNW